MVQYQLKLEYEDGNASVIEDVEEFVTGFRYLYVRTVDGGTLSFERDGLKKVYRRTNKDLDWVSVHLKKSRWVE